MELHFEIYGDPIAQQRPRVTRFVTYSPQAREKEVFQLQIQSKAPKIPSEDALNVAMTFFFKRPKSHYGTGRNSGKLKQSAPKWHTKAKDLDNIAKFYMDAMNKIIYKDDGQIVTLSLEKCYTKNQAKTLISLSSL